MRIMATDNTRIERSDDWKNWTSGLGGTRDKHRGLFFQARPRLTPQTIQALWEQNALVAREIELLADDALREGWEIEDIVMHDPAATPPTVDQIYQWRDELLIDTALVDATKWSRAYGAALLFMPISDGRDTAEQAAPGPTAQMLPLRVIAAPWVFPGETDVDPFSLTYLKTLDYQVQDVGGADRRIHHSRVIPFEAISLPPHALLESGKQWGPSVVERLYDEMGRDGAAASHAVAMMYIASILTLSVKGMRTAFQTKGGPEKLQSWFADLTQRLSSMGLAAIDSEDQLSSIAHANAGTDPLLSRMRERFAAVVSMPREVFFNESPAGLNAGELSGPQALWFQKVKAFQESQLTPALDQILAALFACKGYRVKTWQIRWRDLWVRSDESAAKIGALNAVSDAAYIASAAITPQEVRDYRFVQNRLGALQVDADQDEGALDLTGGIGEDDVAAVAPEPEPTAPPSADPPPADLGAPREIAAFYGLPTRALTAAIDRGELAYWGIGAHKRVSLAAVAQLMKAHESPAPAVVP